MSIDVSATGKQQQQQQHLEETNTLLCRNKCGYYGNSIQYEGYCSICYRKIKNMNQNK